MVYLVEFQLIKEAEKLSVLPCIFQLYVMLPKAGQLELRVIVNVDFHWLQRERRGKGGGRGRQGGEAESAIDSNHSVKLRRQNTVEKDVV